MVETAAPKKPRVPLSVQNAAGRNFRPLTVRANSARHTVNTDAMRSTRRSTTTDCTEQLALSGLLSGQELDLRLSHAFVVQFRLEKDLLDAQALPALHLAVE